MFPGVSAPVGGAAVIPLGAVGMCTHTHMGKEVGWGACSAEF